MLFWKCKLVCGLHPWRFSLSGSRRRAVAFLAKKKKQKNNYKLLCHIYSRIYSVYPCICINVSSCIHNAYTIAPCSHAQRFIGEKDPPLLLMVGYSVGEKDFPLGRSTRGEEERCHVICRHLATSAPLVCQQLGIRQHCHQLQPLQPWHV